MRTTCLKHFIGSYICTLYFSEEKKRLGLIELDDQYLTSRGNRINNVIVLNLAIC